MDSFSTAATLYPLVPYILFAIFGALVGSFLNVVIYRLPHNISLIKPASRCGYCEKPIPLYLNVPIFGWLFLRGKTACCHKPYSFRYPGVEALTSGLFMLSWGATHNLLHAAIYSVFLSLLVAAFFTDLDTMTIPESLTIGPVLVLAAAAYGYLLYAGPAILPALIAAGLGLATGTSILLWLAVSVSWFKKQDAMGMGDIVLMGFAGIFLGFKGVCFAILVGALTSLILRKLPYKPKALSTPDAEVGQFPFGPGLCIGTVGVLFYALFNGWMLPLSYL